MKKSKAVLLVLVSSLVVIACKPEKEEQLYIRGNEEDEYSSAEVNYVHGFHPYYYVSRDNSGYYNRNDTYTTRGGGYESTSIRANSIRNSSSGRYYGYSGARVSRGGFGSSGAHGFGG